MVIVLLILQILLALLFLSSGYSKTFQYNKKEAELKKWTISNQKVSLCSSERQKC